MLWTLGFTFFQKEEQPVIGRFIGKGSSTTLVASCSGITPPRRRSRLVKTTGIDRSRCLVLGDTKIVDPSCIMGQLAQPAMMDHYLGLSL